MLRHSLTAVALLALSVPIAWSAEVSLDGEWMLCRSKASTKPAAGAEWQPVKVPSFLNQSDGRPFLWYRRSFRLPAAFAERHVFLRVGAAKFVSKVYVNGKPVGGHFGGFEPFELEITKACRPDRPNDLLIRVQDVTAVVAEPMDYTKQGRGIRFISQARDSILAPIGSQCTRIGIWQPVRLIARPDVFIADVFIKTSVRKKEIEAEITVRNLSGKPRTVELLAHAYPHTRRAGRPALSLGETSLAVPARSAATTTLRKAWPTPRLWWPHDPHLYVLSVGPVRLVRPVRPVRPARAAPAKQTAAIIDTVATRFGFREFWTDGPHFVLNGTRMKFLATAGHPRGNLDDGLSKKSALAFYRRIREAGCVAMRLHANVWPESWYEAADEIGMPLIMESALFCYSQNYALNKPAFWKNYQDHLAAIIRHKRNHPSIVMVSLENEILHCGGERAAKDCEHRLAEAGRFVKKLDPTRPIMYDGDGDPSTSLRAGPEGVADVVNLHYPLDFNTMNLWPNCARWLEKGMKVRGWPSKFYAWDRKKPLYFGELLHIQHYVTPDPFTTLIGDTAYTGYHDAMARCKALAWEMQIKAYRAADVSGQCPWTLTETGPFPSDDNPRYLAVKRAYQPIAAFIRERDTRFYAGETVTRTVDLYNDTLHPARLRFTWLLAPQDGNLDSGEKQFEAWPARRFEFPIRMRLSIDPLRRRMKLGLLLRIHSGNAMPFVDGKSFWVFQKGALRVPEGVRVALYEGAHKVLNKTLSDAGVEPLRVRDLAKLPPADILLIGPHALDDLKPAQGIPAVGDESGARQALATFVGKGGTAIVLEQDSYACGLLPARLVDRGCTVAFRRTRGDVLLHGTREDDFRFWRGDHVVARKTIAKPQHGRFLAHVDSGGPDGLVYLPLVEVRDGKGRYLLSQLLICEKLGREPVAQLMLENMLRCATTKPPATVKLAVVQDKLRMTEALGETDARFTGLSGKLAATDLSTVGVILAEAHAPEVARNVEKLRQFVQQGSTLILHAGTREGIARLQKLFPEPIVAQPNTSIPVSIADRDRVTDGLTNQDLYWYGSREGLAWRVRTPLSAEVCDHVIGAGLPDPKTCRTFEAEKMAAEHGEPNFRDGEVYMYATAGLKKTIDFPKDGEYAFIVRGKGTPVAGVYPQIAIAVGGKRRGSISTAGEKWGEYFLTTKVRRGKHEVTLAFVNDAYAPEKGEDRNVALDWLRVGPVPSMKAKALLSPPALVKVPLGKGFILLDQIRWDKRPGDTNASRYLSNILTNLNVDFRSPVGGVTIQGADLKPKPGTKLWSSRAGVLYMGTNGTVTTKVRFAKTRRYAFAVRASGTKAGGAYPNIRVDLDGKPIANVSAARDGWQTLRLDATVAAGEHEIALSFTNDFYDPPADRNLRIAHLTIR